jgi:enoyl-CoA hydratase
VTDDALVIERVGHVLVATINRPDRLNALSFEVHEGLRATWRSLADDPSVRAVVITGAGERGFCTGMDLKDFAERGGPPSDHELVTDELQTTPLQCGSWVPTIVAVNGVCTGAGLHFVADADIVIAASDAAFLDPHVSVGQVTAYEAIALARKMPFESMMRMALVGRHERMPAARAHQIGMISEVVDPPEKLREAAQELAEKIARNSPAAMAASKRALWRALELGLTDACKAGALDLVSMWGHPDQTEGPMAFAEKREALWSTAPPPSTPTTEDHR